MTATQCVWPTDVPQVNPQYWDEYTWRFHEDTYRPADYHGGRHDKEAWLEYHSLRGAREFRDGPTRFVNVWKGEDGTLRLNVIDHDVAMMPTTRAPECAQQEYLRHCTRPTPPEAIPMWNAELGKFSSLSFLVRSLEVAKYSDAGWQAELR